VEDVSYPTLVYVGSVENMSLNLAFVVAAHGTPGHLAYFETNLDCRFCRCTQEVLPVDVLVDRIFAAVYGTPGHFA
jgi:hypothetical protein